MSGKNYPKIQLQAPGVDTFEGVADGAFISRWASILKGVYNFEATNPKKSTFFYFIFYLLRPSRILRNFTKKATNRRQFPVSQNKT